jgi:hypothetical protein
VAWPEIPSDFDEWAPPKKRRTQGAWQHTEFFRVWQFSKREGKFMYLLYTYICVVLVRNGCDSVSFWAVQSVLCSWRCYIHNIVIPEFSECAIFLNKKKSLCICYIYNNCVVLVRNGCIT